MYIVVLRCCVCFTCSDMATLGCHNRQLYEFPLHVVLLNCDCVTHGVTQLSLTVSPTVSPTHHNSLQWCSGPFSVSQQGLVEGGRVWS